MMAHSGASALYIALSEGASIWAVGAARVQVISGVVDILGAEVEAGDAQEIVSAPYDGSLRITAKHVSDLRLLGTGDHHEHGEALLRRLVDSGCAIGSSLRRAVLRITEVPELKRYLHEYDTNDPGLHKEDFSCSVHGLVVVRAEPSLVAASSNVSYDTANVAAKDWRSSSAQPLQPAPLSMAARAAPSPLQAVADGISFSRHLDQFAAVVVAAAASAPLGHSSGQKQRSSHHHHHHHEAGTNRCRVTPRPIAAPQPWAASVGAILRPSPPHTQQMQMQLNGYASSMFSSAASSSSAFGGGGISGSANCTPVVMVCGPKGSGKSTYVRFLVNALLSHKRSEIRAIAAANQDAGIYPDDDSTDGHHHRHPHNRNRIDSAAAPLVAYLDLDPGQPEHTTPGLISLSLVHAPLLSPPHMRSHHGVPMMMMIPGNNSAGGSTAPPSAAEQRYYSPSASCHPASAAASTACNTSSPSTLLNNRALDAPSTLLECRFIGANSVREDPLSFILAACDLIDIYRSSVCTGGRSSGGAASNHAVPLVVNAHGWMNGFGFENLQSILSYLKPTHLMHLSASSLIFGGGSGGSGANAGLSSPSFAPGGRGAKDYFGGADNDGDDDGDDDGAGTPSGRYADGPAQSPMAMPHTRFANASSNAEVLNAPELAWQPKPSFGSAPIVRSAGVVLPAWHLIAAQPSAQSMQQRQGALVPAPAGVVAAAASSSSSFASAATAGAAAASVSAGTDGTGGAQAAASSSAAATKGQAPPRAARSPVDLRAARLLTYFLSNLRYPRYLQHTKQQLQPSESGVEGMLANVVGVGDDDAAEAADEEAKDDDLSAGVDNKHGDGSEAEGDADSSNAAPSSPNGVTANGIEGSTSYAGAGAGLDQKALLGATDAVGDSGGAGDGALDLDNGDDGGGGDDGDVDGAIDAEEEEEEEVEQDDDDMAPFPSASSSSSSSSSSPSLSVDGSVAAEGSDERNDGDELEGTDGADGADGAGAADLSALERKPLASLSTLECARLYSLVLLRSAREVFWAVLSGQRLERTCARGVQSPAWHFAKCLPLRVPACDVVTCLAASELVQLPLLLPLDAAAADASSLPLEQQQQRMQLALQQLHAKCACLEGQVVGLCSSAPSSSVSSLMSSPPASTSLSAPRTGAGSHLPMHGTARTTSASPATASDAAVQLALTSAMRLAYALQLGGGNPLSVTSSNTPLLLGTASVPAPATGSASSTAALALVPAARLPCLGLGYVRRYDRLTGQLHIVTPLPFDLVASHVDVLVGWTGAHDLPANLLYRAAPEGDPFCFDPSTVLSGRLGTASKAGQIRKNLKRKRLQK